MGYTSAWLIWIALFIVIEGFALIDKRQGDTLSEHVRKWFRIKDPRPTKTVWVIRGSLMAFLLWLITHFFWEFPW